MSFEIKKIHDPKFFKENCMAAHSDHVAYANETEAEEKKSSFRLLLDGIWKFHYARNYTQTVSVFSKANDMGSMAAIRTTLSQLIVL